jgi:hypothetical protein
MDEARYLNVLLGAKANLALSLLEQPVGNDAFYYGRSVGIIHGLNMAAELLKEQLKDDREKDL